MTLTQKEIKKLKSKTVKYQIRIERNQMTTTSILIYIFLASASLSYFMYGKAQRKAVALFSGIGLGIAPYFGLEMWQLVVISLIMMALPFFVKI